MTLPAGDLRVDMYASGSRRLLMRLTHLPSGECVSGELVAGDTKDGLRYFLERSLERRLIEQQQAENDRAAIVRDARHRLT